MWATRAQGALTSRWTVAAALLLALSMTPTRAHAQQPHSRSITFAVLADPHVGRRRDTATLRRAVEQLRTEQPQPDLVLVVGDLTDGLRPGEGAAYLRLVESLPMPVFDVPGNHDVGFRPTAERVARYERQMGRPTLPRALTVGGRHFVGFNSQWFNTRRAVPAPDDPGFEHMRRLEEVLDSLPPGPIFLLHHIPSVPNFVRMRATPTWHKAFVERYHALVARHPVVGIFAGHFHRDELHFVEHAPLMICPSLSTKYRAVPSYRLVTHDTRGLRYRQVYLATGRPAFSYYRDLRGRGRTSVTRELRELDPQELAHLLRRRHSYGGPGPRRLRRLPPELLRDVLAGDYALWLRRPRYY